jgi:hypothetical protein
MGKKQTLWLSAGVRCWAVLAGASALAPPAASAIQWLGNGKALSAKTAVTIDSKIVIQHKSGTFKFELECDLQLVGTVGPGAEGEVTLVQSLSGGEPDSVACHAIEGTCSTFKTRSLPWATLLETISGVSWDHAKSTAWTLSCGFELLCEGLLRMKFIENNVTGALFEDVGAESSEPTCGSGVSTSPTLKGRSQVLGGFTVS